MKIKNLRAQINIEMISITALSLILLSCGLSVAQKINAVLKHESSKQKQIILIHNKKISSHPGRKNVQ
jgi:putative Mn2+ efflux pump MntP